MCFEKSSNLFYNAGPRRFRYNPVYLLQWLELTRCSSLSSLISSVMGGRIQGNAARHITSCKLVLRSKCHRCVTWEELHKSKIFGRTDSKWRTFLHGFKSFAKRNFLFFYVQNFYAELRNFRELRRADSFAFKASRKQIASYLVSKATFAKAAPPWNCLVANFFLENIGFLAWILKARNYIWICYLISNLIRSFW